MLAKLSVTVTLDCTCLGHLGRLETDRIVSIGQGKKIRYDNARDIVHDIELNITNVKTA